MPHLLHACRRMVSSVIDSDVVNFSVMQVAKAVEGPMDELEAACQAWHDSRDLDQNGWLALASERIQVGSVSNEGGRLSFARARRSR